jgi:subtilisin-like proprotein convertase family protein
MEKHQSTLSHNRGSIMTVRSEPESMRAIALCLMMLTALLVPIASAASHEEHNGAQTGEEGVPFIPPATTPIIDSYSPNIRAAIAQHSDLHAYTAEELGTAKEWVVFSSQSIGEPTAHLKGAYILEMPLKEAYRTLPEWQASGLIEAAYPLVERSMEPRWTPNDPKFNDQWHLVNTGQTGGTSGEDVNITGAWNSYKGSGIVIGIVDDGLDWNHPDLATNYESTLDYDFCNNDNDPTPTSNNAHGTAAGGVAAATGNNGVGVTGSAPGAGLAGLQLISCSTTDVREGDTLSHERQDIDIYSNSWGPSDNGETLSGPGPLMMAAMENDALLGRNGLGNLITWAAGNGLDDDDNSNYDGYANLRYTIAVTAVDHKGQQSYYAEPGANILVASPSNGDGESITTTDIEGSGGYTSNDYTNTFGGTSSATPLVSGILALMLEANANLTWRDVQHILVHSSRQNDASDTSWGLNGAGIDVSHKYGYGVIDAGAAVSMAETWTSVEEEISFSSGTITVNTDILDNDPNYISSTTTVSDAILVENVDVIVDIPHEFRGDLEIILTSPSGTQSILSEKHDDENSDYNNWRFSTVHNWDEDSRGDWSLTVEDQGNNDVGSFDEWELIVYGTQINLDSDGDGLSDTNETGVYGTDPNDIDTDDDNINDGLEVLVYGTDPLSKDTDEDGLEDGIEILVNGTDPLDNDTDDDLLSDGDEVNIYGTNPLVFDADGDADGYYWFQDCNDSNPDVYPSAIELLNGIDDDCNGTSDEGFNLTDADNDGLFDYEEFHDYGTDWQNADSDGDFLDDGEEVLIHLTDPLTKDNDSDMDGFYWFQDCDDTNASLNPSIAESLDGIDNNCNEQIDEDFIGTDADLDGLLDMEEYLEHGTNPFDADTDGDGLLDGIELFSTNTDPLYPDLDTDGDGYRWFNDCNDNDSTVYPGATELWNGIDDDCDEAIDQGIDRSAYLSATPQSRSQSLNATNDSLQLSLTVSLDEGTIERLGLTVEWFRNDSALATGFTFEEQPFNCSVMRSEFAAYLCETNGTVGPESITAVISDARGQLNVTWSVTYLVWNPPLPPVTEDSSDAIEDSDFLSNLDVSTPLIVSTLLFIIALLLFLISRPRRPTSTQSAFTVKPQAYIPPQFANVPSAPDLGSLPPYDPRR